MFKRLFVLVLLALATMFVTSPAHAEAPAGATRLCAKASGNTSSALALGEIHRYWYSDATYTTVVGYEYLNECDGSYQFWGVRTSYLSWFRTHCWA